MQKIIVNNLAKLFRRIGVGKLFISETKKEAGVKLVLSLIISLIAYKGLISTIYDIGKVKLYVLLPSILGLIFGAIIFTSALFKLIFSLNAVNEDGDPSEELQKTNSMPLILFWFFIAAFLFFPVKSCYNEQKRYKEEQLHLYGKTLKIKISEIFKRSKSGKKARFFFENKGEIIEKTLDARDFKEGDEAYITFSTENPNIIVWTDEKQKETELELLYYYKWQRIIINEIYFDSKLGKRAKFTYENYGKYFESNLPAKKFKVGDTVEIIFSKENTNIMGWSYNEAIIQ